MILYSICLSPSDLFHLAQCLQGPYMLSQMTDLPSFYDWIIFHHICVCILYISIFLHLFFIYFCISGLLSHFHILSVINNTTMNTAVQKSWDSDYVSFEYKPRNGINGSCGSSIFYLLRNLYTFFYSRCANLHSHQQCIRFPSLHIISNTHYLLSLTAILTDMRWHLTVVWFSLSLW